MKISKFSYKMNNVVLKNIKNKEVVNMFRRLMLLSIDLNIKLNKNMYTTLV